MVGTQVNAVRRDIDCNIAPMQSSANLRDFR